LEEFEEVSIMQHVRGEGWRKRDRQTDWWSMAGRSE
jgi:hypothetical protein